VRPRQASNTNGVISQRFTSGVIDAISPGGSSACSTAQYGNRQQQDFLTLGMNINVMVESHGRKSWSSRRSTLPAGNHRQATSFVLPTIFRISE
jgi:hypothetical protein